MLIARCVFFALARSLFVIFLAGLCTPCARADLIYDFDDLTDGALGGQDGWVHQFGGGTTTVSSGVLSFTGDTQHIRQSNFNLSGDMVTVEAQLSANSSTNGPFFAILHSSGTGLATDYIFQAGSLGSEWRLRDANLNGDIREAGTGAAELTSTLTDYIVRLEMDLSAPGGAASLFVNDVFVLEDTSLGLSSTHLDPGTWTTMHLRSGTGPTLDSLSFSSAAVPEPSSAAFLGLAGCAALGFRRRKSRRPIRIV